MVREVGLHHQTKINIRNGKRPLMWRPFLIIEMAPHTGHSSQLYDAAYGNASDVPKHGVRSVLTKRFRPSQASASVSSLIRNSLSIRNRWSLYPHHASCLPADFVAA